MQVLVSYKRHYWTKNFHRWFSTYMLQTTLFFFCLLAMTWYNPLCLFHFYLEHVWISKDFIETMKEIGNKIQLTIVWAEHWMNVWYEKKGARGVNVLCWIFNVILEMEGTIVV